MRKSFLLSALLLTFFALGCAGKVAAQEASTSAGEVNTAPAAAKPPVETKSQTVYRLDYVVRELDAVGDKRINSRSYTIYAGGQDGWGRVRVGSSVPLHAEAGGIQYRDVGINIDYQPRSRESGIVLFTNFESSSAPSPESNGAPAIRRISFSGDSVVALGKPTVIARLDDVVTNHRFEVEVTATKVP